MRKISHKAGLGVVAVVMALCVAFAFAIPASASPGKSHGHKRTEHSEVHHKHHSAPAQSKPSDKSAGGGASSRAQGDNGQAGDGKGHAGISNGDAAKANGQRKAKGHAKNGAGGNQSGDQSAAGQSGTSTAQSATTPSGVFKSVPATTAACKGNAQKCAATTPTNSVTKAMKPPAVATGGPLATFVTALISQASGQDNDVATPASLVSLLPAEVAPRFATTNATVGPTHVAALGPKAAGTKSSTSPPRFSRFFQEPLEFAAAPWAGPSLKTATGLALPILFGLGVALFVLLQSFVDRRDPKLARAPRRGDDDTVGFR